jgi:hypothetical protein
MDKGEEPMVDNKYKDVKRVVSEDPTKLFR